MRVLVIDDHEELRELLTRALARDEHELTTAATLAEADAALRERRFDVVVLDLALPDGWGTSWCRAARHAGLDAAILVLTAHGEVEHRLDGFDAGADDFLSKPFSVAELRARLRALGRWRPESLGEARAVGEAQVSFRSRQATRNGEPVGLTAREWAVLEHLEQARGRVVSREALLRELWGEVTESNAASLEVLVSRIRRKLGAEALHTHRGDGYALGR